MSWLQFIASVISSLAWPVAITAVVALLRKPLARLIVSLHHLSVRGVEMDFGQAIANLEFEADQAKIPDLSSETSVSQANPTVGGGANTIQPQSRAVDVEIKALALLSSEAAITRAWVEIERAIEQTKRRLGYDTVDRTFARRDIETLHDAQYLDDETYRILARLSRLRNQAAHRGVNEAEITYSDALDYAHLAKRMVQRLSMIELR